VSRKSGKNKLTKLVTESELSIKFFRLLSSVLRTLGRGIRKLEGKFSQLVISDDSRFGLKPICCKRITASGVAPVALQQWRFEWRWLYGLVNPLSGESFFWEYSGLDQRCFEHVLAQFAQQYPDEQHMLQMDQSAVHRATTLAIPAAVTLPTVPS